MTALRQLEFRATDLDMLAEAPGWVAVFVPADRKMSPGARRLNRLTKGAVARAVDGDAWDKTKPGDSLRLNFPAGMAAEAVLVIKLDRRPSAAEARKAGAAIAAAADKPVTVLAESVSRPADIALGLALRSYAFSDHKTEETKTPGKAVVMCSRPDDAKQAAAPMMAAAQGAFFTRDLVNEPANVLTTTEFASRLQGLSELGVEVKVLEEPELAKLGMGALLAVGQGSEAPSKVVVMRWKGAKDAPLALVGKGVVFDTGGISLKPAAGMEDMTMDMGGAGVVAGVMKTLALRKAKAHVVGIVGLVENMPSGNAQRPGDIVRSMKGDTIEVINTDAEGRLVLADIMWHVQEAEKPAAMIDLATLTGACIIALGHENAAVFSNDDGLAGDFLKAAQTEGEGAWRMPLAPAYDEMLKSPLADMKNVGGRPAGAITAAQFLQRFVKEGTPWIHLDIAGVAHIAKDTVLAPQGATGWGVLSLDRLVRDRFES
ncbi:leucyl aminopeptidase [Thalassococcus sp. CAU 1522]|uniref:Probable cytosol aminopeptidase n=1 Tax=Thalassococcus arenae TaxID=2851652 RepID=A0ABS6NBE5_9RHOB|nr:leucyl aminopeptidase [Thalassococcus arenae]MBV2361346.1 leucyl aminopeptidase [Thalassococcus arenae]